MANNTDIPELISLRDACKILKVHANTLRNWDKKGLLVAVRLGEKKVRRYRKVDLEKFINKKNRVNNKNVLVV